jgi:hypothetical protein
MGRASSGTALCTRAASAIRENTRNTRSGRNCLALGLSMYIACGVSAVWRVRSCSIGGAGPRPGTRPARPAGRPRPTRAGEEGPGAGRPGRGRRPHTNPHLELANLFRITSEPTPRSDRAQNRRITHRMVRPHGAAVDSVIRRNLRLEALMTGTQYQPSHSHTLAATQDDGQKLIY